MGLQDMLGGSRQRLPDFVLIGAAKSGTSALYSYLKQHPRIYLPDHQEPSFFAFEDEEIDFRGPGGTAASVNVNAVRTLSAYTALFEPAPPDAKLGDVSPVYLYWPAAAERVRRYIPSARIIASLRNPADRAYSSFMHACRENKEPLQDFASGLQAEPARIQDNWGFLWRYADMGHYLEQLKRYYDRLDPNQIKVILYDDFRDDPVAVCKELWHFLGIDPSFVPDTRLAHNVSGIPRSQRLHRVLDRQSRVGRLTRRVAPLVGRERLRSWQTSLKNRNLQKLTAPEVVRRELLDSYRTEIVELQGLIGRDLSRWLE